MKTGAEHLISFYKNLKPPKNLPANIEWLYPQKDAAVMKIVEQFFHQYYSDAQTRTLLLGINPGRFGAGVTGVNFTAPKQLKQFCGIEHSFKNQSELSAEFIYEMIEAYGGVEKFYANSFIGSVCPLGFIKNGKNINYYDDKELLSVVNPFIEKSMKQLIDFNVNRNVCFCIGGEKNYKYLSALNEKHHWFETIKALPHPRFIMQYKRKQKQQYIEQYVQCLSNKNLS